MAECTCTGLAGSAFTYCPVHDADLVQRIKAALREVMDQADKDLKSAHAEICKLQGLDPAKHDWPQWSPQANSIRWHEKLRHEFGL